MCEGWRVSLEVGRATSKAAVHIRPMLAADLGAADRVMRLAFGTIRGLPDPEAAFGDRDLVKTRFYAAPECAWVAELDGDVVGSVFAARWGSFGFFGPLTVHPSLWDQGIGSGLLRPVLEAFERWDVRQAGLFTFAASSKHLGLYQKHGFWPGHLTVVTAKTTDPQRRSAYTVTSREMEAGHDRVLDEIRRLTDQVFPGLDLGQEIVSVSTQRLGDTVLMRREGTLEGMAVCHCGAGSEAGSDTCHVKFAAVRPGRGASGRFAELLDACEAFAVASGLGRLEAGVNTGRLDAYRHLLDRGFRIEQIGISMLLRPQDSHFDAPTHHVIADCR
jgi:N-acetylglutamate synthase-like GNAT family acetyltransferase